MTNDLNDHIFRFSCFVMSMQTAIIQGVKNCLPLGLADGAVSTDPSPTRQNGRRRPTSWARTGSMMLFSTATNLRLGFSQGGYFNWHPLQTCGRGGQNPVANRDSLGWRHKNYRHQRVATISDRSIENATREYHFSKASQPPVTPCAVDTYNLVPQKTWRTNSQFLRWKFA